MLTCLYVIISHLLIFSVGVHRVISVVVWPSVAVKDADRNPRRLLRPSHGVSINLIITLICKHHHICWRYSLIIFTIIHCIEYIRALWVFMITINWVHLWWHKSILCLWCPQRLDIVDWSFDLNFVDFLFFSLSPVRTWQPEQTNMPNKVREWAVENAISFRQLHLLLIWVFFLFLSYILSSSDFFIHVFSLLHLIWLGFFFLLLPSSFITNSFSSHHQAGILEPTLVLYLTNQSWRMMCLKARNHSCHSLSMLLIMVVYCALHAG